MLRKAVAGVAATIAVAALPLAVHADPVPAPDHIETANVKYIGNVAELGDGVGARIVGNYMYVTSTAGLFIYDVSNPVNPVRVGTFSLAVEWENEEVPTNGKVLGISASGVVPLVGGGGCALAPPADYAANQGKNCLAIFDVTDKANPKVLSIVFGAGNHTSACLLDCTYFWGSTGAVTDARDPAHAKLIGNWNDPANHLPGQRPHHVREIQPGIVLTATQPVMLLSVRPEDGGSVLHPKLLATGENTDHRFIHSNRWNGKDIFALIGGETNIQPTCGTNNGAFMTWDSRPVINPDGGFNLNSQFKMIDEYRPRQGTYTDGGQPVGVLGCSVHWFEEHPTFHNGGLVALAAYESGTRFLQITSTGKIIEQGYFIPVGRGSTSAPHWAPDGKTVYTIDYERGFDILQWTGPTYVPNQATNAAATPAPQAAVPPATGGSTPLPLTTAGAPRDLAWLLLVVIAIVAGLAAAMRRRAA